MLGREGKNFVDDVLRPFQPDRILFAGADEELAIGARAMTWLTWSGSQVVTVPTS